MWLDRVRTHARESSGPYLALAPAPCAEDTTGLTNPMPESTVFVILSFEGPDDFSRVGGLATRVASLVNALARRNYETHLFFIGDPALPGVEAREDGKLRLHRWCQWLSAYHSKGPYDGEEAKLQDWTASLPQYLADVLLPDVIASGRDVVVMAEEWQTAHVMISLKAKIDAAGWQDRVRLMWNANNTYGFHRIDWPALKKSAAITTVSRYMKYVMHSTGIEASVLPNGIDDDLIGPVDEINAVPLASALRGRTALTKVARWDVEKRWDYAVDATALLKSLGHSPVLFARGGSPSKSGDVIARMARLGLRVERIQVDMPDTPSLATELMQAAGADVVLIERLLNSDQCRMLYHVSDAVLANSAFEPFGLVGLETMAAGGIAAVGSTGEDYVTHGYDAISLQTDDVREFVRWLTKFRREPACQESMRREARISAARFTWGSVLERSYFPYLEKAATGVQAEPELQSGRHRAESDVYVGRPVGQAA